MYRRVFGVLTVMLSLLAAPAAAGASSVAGPGGQVVERDCYEINEIFPVPMADLVRQVPARYTPQPWAGDPQLGAVATADYVCQTTRAGALTWHRRGMTTMGLTILSGRDGVPSAAYFVLWFGTDNPVLAATFARLGLDLPPMPANRERVTPGSDGTTRIVTDYRGGGLDHRRDTVATEPPAGPVDQVQSAPFYAVGRHGEVRWAYLNRIRPQSTGTFTLTVPAGGRLAEAGLPATASGQTGFLRGEWSSSPALTGTTGTAR